MSKRCTIARLGLLLMAVALLAGCDQQAKELLHAGKATARTDLVGGPVAYADTGDFILENDKVRVAILGFQRSWGPGVFGGSLVDADIRRDDPRYPPGYGRDKLAEIFPFANLLVPAPLGGQVTVVKDGSDGQEAVIRVEGKGMFMFEALSVLETQRKLLAGLGYPDVHTSIDFRTDYLLKPGDQFVTMRTWVALRPRASQSNQNKGFSEGASCTNDASCGSGGVLVCQNIGTAGTGTCGCKSLADQGCGGETCAMAHNFDDFGCQQCGCSGTATMTNTTGPVSVFAAVLGPKNPGIGESKTKAGVGGGDFVFFGNQTDIFVPGHGFDEEKPVWDALFNNVDTFGHPLVFDFVSAAGGEVSYAYYTKKQAGQDKEPQVLVPVFTSAATAFVTAAVNCSTDPSDDDSCDKVRVFEYERYLAIGQGDIASVSDIVWKHRATATGTVKGYVRWEQTGQAVANASVHVLRDPDPTKKWTSLQEVVQANRAIDASPGVLDSVDADVGADTVEDGAFEATLPAGHYVLVPMDPHKVVTGAPLQIEVKAGKTNVVVPSLPAPARLRVKALDSQGSALPAKATVVRLGSDGKPLFRDGGRLPYFGQGRLGIGIERLAFGMDGSFDLPIQAGTYRLVVSHGIEWSVADQVVTLKPGEERSLKVSLAHEVDTTGWLSTDFHLHAEPSFDSGMPLGDRVQTIAAEGVDYVASTDHDVLSDYVPFLRKFNLDQWLKAVVGSEVSTLEIGHYIGFPLKYNQVEVAGQPHNAVPSHGSVDWYCTPSNDLLKKILASSGMDGGQASTIIAHPRDGFLGWLDQAGVNAYSLTRTLSLMEQNNPVLRTVACDQDAMEVFNGKRFDMTHTATVKEVQLFSRCLKRIDDAGVTGNTVDAASAREVMKVACPELADRGLQNVVTFEGVDSCPADEDITTCKMRYRMALAAISAGDINTRTPEEQAAWMAEGQSLPSGATEQTSDTALSALKPLCDFDPAKLSQPFETAVPPASWNRPCGRRDGVLSDYFRFLEHGYVRGIVGGSDSHGYKQEPGLPRTYIRSNTDAPSNVDPQTVGESLRGSHTVPSYGPFIDVKVLGGGPGDTVKATAGQKLKVHVKVQTASWFGVDRVEVYLNGQVAQAFDLAVDASRVVDFDKDVELDVPTRDSHIVVVALGAQPGSWMRPVYLDVPFGELQLARVASIAFSSLLGSLAKTVFPPPARIPDFFPVFPMAISSAVLVDVGGDGKYDAPLPLPAFCSPQCDATTGEIQDAGYSAQGKKRKCSDLQSNYKCLTPENRCGVDVPGVCNIYSEQKAGALRSLLGTH